MKKFKTRKKHRLFKFIIFIIFGYIFFKITLNILNNNYIDPSKYISYLVNLGFNNQLSNNSIYKGISLVENNLSMSLNNKNEEVMVNYIEKVNDNISNPIVYIYNTHENEEYKIEYKYDYSIVPNVKIASYILQEDLINNNIGSYVETNSVNKILNDNNWIYKDSYKASRMLLDSNNNYKYYIDIHRDSSNYDKTTLNYNGNNYAKILFVVGLEHDSFEYNLKIANELSEMINKNINGLSKGVLKKEGIGVNGVYNQDFNHNCILIEVGGMDNNILEVSNSLKVFANVFSEYIKGE